MSLVQAVLSQFVFHKWLFPTWKGYLLLPLACLFTSAGSNMNVCVRRHFVLAPCLESLLKGRKWKEWCISTQQLSTYEMGQQGKIKIPWSWKGAYETSRDGSFALFLQMTTGLLCWLATSLAFLALMEASQRGDMTERARNKRNPTGQSLVTSLL